MNNLSANNQTIDLLCDVIDNFGDIGFVYRLAKSLSKEIQNSTETRLRISVKGINSFAKMCPFVDNSKSCQTIKNNQTNNLEWEILNWEDQEACLLSYRKIPPQKILQCFQCTRPYFFDQIIFSRTAPSSVIINIDYLTAEEWAKDFHLKKGVTPVQQSRKINFMPGFMEGTGGLIFTEHCQNNLTLQKLFPKVEFSTDFKIFIFGYEKDYTPLLKSISRFSKISGRKCTIFTADRKNNFEQAVKSAPNVQICQMEFVTQEQFDSLLTEFDFLFIRGEDSWARASLLGTPFLWQAYKQDEQYQLIKVDAFVKLLTHGIETEQAKILENAFFSYNTTFYNRFQDLEEFGTDSDTVLYSKKFLPLFHQPEELKKFEEDSILNLLLNIEKIQPAYKRLSEKLHSLGNLTNKIVEILNKIR